MSDTFDDSGRPRAATSLVYASHLVVLLECDRPLSGSARYSLEDIDQVTIGRGKERLGTRRNVRGLRSLDLRVPGRSMSASHARLLRVGSTWAIEDTESTNGTCVNGKRVGRAVLGPEDVCELGHTLLRVNPSLGVPLDAPSDVDICSATGAGHTTLDPVFAAQLETVAKLALSDVAILVAGESGTGKEVFARWIHGLTGRKGEFVGVNCGAIPAALIESHLFGHAKGAFSGAVRDEVGFIRSADGGTLLLDEIADLPQASQAALLRVLQEREVVPVGATRPIPVDVRLVSATHESLDELVARGEFRRDLFARIAGAVLELPALRERRDDIGILVGTLLSKLAPEQASSLTLSPEVGRALVSYDWPLNIRELEQCLKTCVALARQGEIELSHLPSKVRAALDRPVDSQRPSASALNERDQQLRLELLAQLSEHAGNLADVARAMGKARMQVHRWCRRFGIDAKVYRR